MSDNPTSVISGVGRRRLLTRVAVALSFGFVGLLFGAAVQAHDRHEGADWGGQWWQFMSSIPASVNPLFDTTGEDCMIGQRGDVWFIGGVMGARMPDGTFLGGGGAATRECTIPQGKALFFPVINGVVFDTPGACGQGAASFTMDELIGQVTPYVDLADKMSVTLDGKKKTRFQRLTSTFDVTLPEKSMWDQLCSFYGLGNLPGGVYKPAYQDGYYTLLKPLKLGDHTIRIQGTEGEFSLDVTYHIHVVPGQAK